MKYCIILADGMADEPLELFGGETPLSAAHTPYMDAVATAGRVGLVETTPPGHKAGSDSCNMQILGYDSTQCCSGRAPLEAAAQHLQLADDEVAFRCNLVTVDNGCMSDYSAGAISTKEGAELIELLNRELGSDKLRFYVGKGYRHLLVIKGRPELAAVPTTPPHDITDRAMQDYLPAGEAGYFLQEIMAKSHEVLRRAELNQVRLDLGENPANMVWLWGQGGRPSMELFSEKYGLQGAVISAVDLLRGIGELIGLNAIEVPGITGYYDTDYRAKGAYGLKALEDNDLIFIHIEAPDEAGHAGNALMKMRAIEEIDRHIVKPFYERMQQGDLRLLVLPDHPTPVRTKTHSEEAVPFAVAGSGIAPDRATALSEMVALDSGYRIRRGYTLMNSFLKASFEEGL